MRYRCRNETTNDEQANRYVEELYSPVQSSTAHFLDSIINKYLQVMPSLGEERN